MKKETRHKFNPFLKNMLVHSKSSPVRISRLGKDNHILLNQATGEAQGTHITTYRKVDDAQFVKLFTKNIALTFELKAAGIKVFNVLMWAVQHKAIDKDIVPLDMYLLEDFLAYHAKREPPIKLSLTTFRRGLPELEKAGIIAKTLRPGQYYINPNFCFNGDRIAFSTVIERTKGDAHLQQNLLEDSSDAPGETK